MLRLARYARGDSEAGEKVAEIDALVLEGKLPQATRRCRELLAITWDQAIDAIRIWHNLTRPQKLARCGWQSKEILQAEDPGWRDHPLRDRLLDG